MTIEELVRDFGYKVITGSAEDLKHPVKGVYACDLLSHAMAKVNSGDLWITIHTNINVVAVASLTDAACVLIPEGIAVEPQTVERAAEKGVVILSSPSTTAQVCHEVLSMIGMKS
jgi:hypothetical protein